MCVGRDCLLPSVFYVCVALIDRTASDCPSHALCAFPLGHVVYWSTSVTDCCFAQRPAVGVWPRKSASGVRGHGTTVASWASGERDGTPAMDPSAGKVCVVGWPFLGTVAGTAMQVTDGRVCDAAPLSQIQSARSPPAPFL